MSAVHHAPADGVEVLVGFHNAAIDADSPGGREAALTELFELIALAPADVRAEYDARYPGGPIHGSASTRLVIALDDLPPLPPAPPAATAARRPIASTRLHRHH